MKKEKTHPNKVRKNVHLGGAKNFVGGPISPGVQKHPPKVTTGIFFKQKPPQETPGVFVFCQEGNPPAKGFLEKPNRQQHD